MMKTGLLGKLRHLLAGVPGIAARGGVAENGAGLLEQEQRARRGHTELKPITSTTVTAGEQALGAATGTTITGTVSNALRQLAEAGTQLIKGHEKATAAVAKKRHHQLSDHERTQLEDHDRQRRVRETDPNPVGPDVFLVAAWLLVAARITVGGCETAFWYLNFARGISSSVGWLSPDRISAGLVSVFIPLPGVLAAELAGGQVGRWYRTPARDAAGRQAQKAGVTTSLAILSAACVGLYALVMWRYDTSKSLSLSTPMPGWAVATLFVAVLLALTTMKAFADDITSHHEKKLGKQLHLRRMADEAVDLAVVTAEAIWATAAHRLATLITRLITDIEQYVFVAEDVLASARACNADEAPEAAGTSNATGAARAVGGRQPLHVAGPDDQFGGSSEDRDRLPVPELPETLWHTKLPLVHARLDAVAQAIALLRAYAPSVSEPTATADKLTERLRKLTDHLSLQTEAEQGHEPDVAA